MTRRASTVACTRRVIPAQGSRPAHTARNIARFFGRSFALSFAFLCGKALSCSKLVDIYIRNILTRGSFLWAVWLGSFRGPSAKYFDHDSIFLDFAHLCSFVALFSWLLVVGSRHVSTFIASTHYPLFIRNWLVNPRTIHGHMTDQSHNCSYMSIIPCLLKQACSTSPPGGNQVDGLPPVVHYIFLRNVEFQIGT